MPRWTLLPILALAACSSGGADEDGRAAPGGSTGSSLVGLYERAGVPDAPGRICMSAAGGELRFGLRSSDGEPESCTMTGRVRQAGSALTLLIDGEPDCSVTATVTATGLMLAEPEGPDCAYHCGQNVQLDGGAFAKVGGARGDALRLVDIAGEPLCD